MLIEHFNLWSVVAHCHSRSTAPPNKCAAANRRYAIEFVSHWFYNIIGFGGRALSAPVAELDRQAA